MTTPMTTPPAFAQPTRQIGPEALGHTRLGDAEHRVVVKLLFWLVKVGKRDLAHPGHRRWGVPTECVLLSVPSLLDAAHRSGPLFAAMAVLNGAGSLTLHTEGDLTGLTQGLQLAVYRIVQEALTNTLKYAAPDTTVTVAVVTDGDLVRVTVEDTGPLQVSKGGHRSPGSGHGLVGMRERATLYDGTLDAGPNPRGGWTVRAFLTATPPAAKASMTTEKHPV